MQLSLAGGMVKVTGAKHCPGLAGCEMFDGHTANGGVTSLTVTVNEQLVLLPAPSVAVRTTVVVPTTKELPGKCVLTKDTPVQLSVGVGRVNGTDASQVKGLLA